MKHLYFLLCLLLQVHVVSAQSASFTASVNSGCVPLTVSFQNSSTGAASYQWSFSNGATSIATDPVVVFNNPGVYSATLIATAANGNKDTLVVSNMISASPVPVADFSIPVTSGCPQQQIFTFQNLSSNAASYLWNFGDGSYSTDINPFHIYQTSGVFYVSLTATSSDGCSSFYQTSVPVNVYSSASPDFTASSQMLCQPGIPVTFNAVAGFTSYSWDFGDGNFSSAEDPVYSYLQPGNYSVKLITTSANGCHDTIFKTNYILVRPAYTPVINVSDTTGCPPFAVNFNSGNNTNITGWSWDFGDSTTSALPSPQKTYYNPGNYDVHLTVQTIYGCSYSGTVNSLVEIPDLPVAHFSMVDSIGCNPLSVQFINQSQNAVSYLWESGNGGTSTANSPLFQYTGNTFYTPKLHAYNIAGCEQVYQVNNGIQVKKPTAGFTASSTIGCAPLQVSFSNQSIGGSANQYTWYFGDGATSATMNGSHIYTTPGYYTVSLVSVSPDGCRDSTGINQLIHVTNPAGNYITPPPFTGCAPFTFSLSDSTLNGQSWLWNFGDGSTSSSQNPQHTYQSPGTYTVSLTVIINGGCTLFYPSFAVYNIGGIEAIPYYTMDCSTMGVVFTDSSSNSVSATWNFEGTLVNADQYTVSYPANGFYSYSLTVTDQLGCQDIHLGLNEINFFLNCPQNSSGNSGGGSMSPTPGFQFTGCVPFEVNLQNPLPSEYTFISWETGDGSLYNQPSVIHTYQSPGIYTAVLNYEYNGIVYAIPYDNFAKIGSVHAGFSVTDSSDCTNLTLQVTDQSVNSSSWNWNFNGGIISSQQNPQVNLNSSGTYLVSQTVQDSLGCSDQTVVYNFTPVNINVWADDYEVCNSSAVHFFTSSTLALNCHWDFGDGTTSTQCNPTHQYTATGNYNVIFTGTDQNGCTHVIPLSQPIVHYIPQADFTYSQTGNCESTIVQFTNLSTGMPPVPAGYYSWAFGNGTSVWTTNPLKNYQSTGLYNVTLTAGMQGCSNAITLPVAVGKPHADFSYIQDKTCLPVTATFSDQSVGVTSWFWDFGDGTTSSLQNPVHVYQSAPQNPVTLIVQDSRGCSDTIVKPSITLYEGNAHVFTTSGCAPLSVAFSGISNGTVAWEWSFGDGNSSSLSTPQHTYTNGGVYYPVLISFAADGCSDTINLPAINIDQPQLNFSASSTGGCNNVTYQFQNQSSGAINYLWSFGDGATSSVINPSHTYSSPGYYSVTLTGTTATGCIDSLMINNIVHVPGPDAEFSYTTISSCNGAEVYFQNEGDSGMSYSWNFGDGTTSADEDPIHFYYAAGTFEVTFTVTDQAGCMDHFVDEITFTTTQGVFAQYYSPDTSGCSPFTVQFENSSVNNSVSTWYWGDGSSTVSNDTLIIHEYAEAGIFPVTLVVVSSEGCADTISTVNIYVHEAPEAVINSSSPSGCVSHEVNFSYLSQDPVTGVNWSFSNGISSTQPSPSVTFTNGSWNVSLTLTNNEGCSSTLTHNQFVQVNDSIPPAAHNFSRVTVLNNSSVLLEWPLAIDMDFDHYTLYRKDQSGIYQQIAIIPVRQLTQFVDSSVTTLYQSWCYKITIADTCGFESDVQSSNSHCTIETHSSAVAAAQVNISWNFYQGTGVKNYTIYRKTPVSNQFDYLATVSSGQNFYTDTTAYCGGRYEYKVLGTGLGGTTLYSSSDTTISDVSGIEFGNLTASVTRSTVVNNEAVLTEWTVPNSLAHLTGYFELQRSENGTNYTVIQTLPAGASSYIDTDVNVHSQNYFYRIRTYSVCEVPGENSGISSSILLQTERINEFEVKLFWTAYQDWVTGVEKYEIQKKDEFGNWTTIKVVGAETTNHTITE